MPIRSAVRRPKPVLRWAALAAVGFLCAGAARADTVEETRRRLQVIEKQIDAARADQKARHGEAARLAEQIRTLQGRLVAAAGETQGYEQAMIETEARLNELSGRTYAYRARLEDRELDLTQTVAALVRFRRQPHVVALANAESTLETLRTSRLLSAASGLMETEANALRQRIGELAALRDDIAAERQRLEGLSGKLGNARTTLASLLDDMRERQLELRRKRADTGRNLTVLTARAGSIRELLERLEEQQAQAEAMARAREQARLANERAVREKLERERRDLAAQLAARNAAPPAPAPTPEEKETPQRTAALPPVQGGKISDARGRLSAPVRGRVVKDFGEQADTGLHEKGVTLLALEDAQVISPFDGAIAFAGPFRDYGLVLIISHGEGYHTLLAGLTRSYVQTGQQVLAGEPVGQMGRGGNEQRSLYVELRHKGEAVDPRRWWARTGRKVTG
jgi:septal ring factor EnvC (AmiA/AmiB activator)